MSPPQQEFRFQMLNFFATRQVKGLDEVLCEFLKRVTAFQDHVTLTNQ